MRFIKSNKKCNACPPVVQVHYMTHSVSPLRLVVFFSVYMSYHTGNIIYDLIMITSVGFFLIYVSNWQIARFTYCIPLH